MPHPLTAARTLLKVCCISSVAEMRAAVSAGADAIGLVGRMPSGPGVISDAQIAEIVSATPPAVLPFLLSSETTAAGLSDHIRRTGARVLQIVSHVSPSVYPALRAALPPGTLVVQVIHVEGEASAALARAYGGLADALLLDSGRPSAGELGGTGRTHNWSVSAQIVAASPVPVFLAGGLRAGNVAAAVSAVRPAGVDLCSGVRTDGRLDPEKLSAFTRSLRGSLE